MKKSQSQTPAASKPAAAVAKPAAAAAKPAAAVAKPAAAAAKPAAAAAKPAAAVAKPAAAAAKPAAAVVKPAAVTAAKPAAAVVPTEQGDMLIDWRAMSGRLSKMPFDKRAAALGKLDNVAKSMLFHLAREVAALHDAAAKKDGTGYFAKLMEGAGISAGRAYAYVKIGQKFAGVEFDQLADFSDLGIGKLTMLASKLTSDEVVELVKDKKARGLSVDEMAKTSIKQLELTLADSESVAEKTARDNFNLYQGANSKAAKLQAENARLRSELASKSKGVVNPVPEQITAGVSTANAAIAAIVANLQEARENQSKEHLLETHTACHPILRKLIADVNNLLGGESKKLSEAAGK